MAWTGVAVGEQVRGRGGQMSLLWTEYLCCLDLEMANINTTMKNAEMSMEIKYRPVGSPVNTEINV